MFEFVDSESVFKPGNLIHGVLRGSPEKLNDILSVGVKSGLAVDPKIYRSNHVCMGLLKDQPLPVRYKETTHTGPVGDAYEDRLWGNRRLAFIISNPQLIAAYPHQLFAIGSAFQNEGARDKIIRILKLRKKTVYDIPVKNPSPDEIWWRDEVRLYPDKKSPGQSPIISPETIVGLVITERGWELFENEYKNAPKKLPVFSPECIQLGTIGA